MKSVFILQLELVRKAISLLLRCPGVFVHSEELVCGPPRRRMHFPNSSRHGLHRLC